MNIRVYELQSKGLKGGYQGVKDGTTLWVVLGDTRS